MAHETGVAGESAQEEFDRRRSKDRAVLRRRWPLFVAITIATPIGVYAGVRLGLPRLLDALIEGLPAAGSDVRPEPIDGRTFHVPGLLVALGATVWVGHILWGMRASTESWGKGAQGERMTGRLLQELPREFDVHHDLPIPGSTANIDHLVVGPTGAFTIETKHYGADIVVSGSGAAHRGRPLDGVVQQAQRQATVASSRLGVPVQPVVLLHGGAVRTKGGAESVVDGVRFMSGKKLPRYLRTRQNCDADEVERARETAAEWAGVGARSPVNPSKPAEVAVGAETECRCGGRWVQRCRRRDGQPFLGCSAYPQCRQTRPLPA